MTLRRCLELQCSKTGFSVIFLEGKERNEVIEF